MAKYIKKFLQGLFIIWFFIAICTTLLTMGLWAIIPWVAITPTSTAWDFLWMSLISFNGICGLFAMRYAEKSDNHPVNVWVDNFLS